MFANIFLKLLLNHLFDNFNYLTVNFVVLLILCPYMMDIYCKNNYI